MINLRLTGRTTDARAKIDEDTSLGDTSLGPSQMPPPACMTTLAPLYMAQSHVCLSLADCACLEPMCWADGSFVAQNHSADSLSDDSFFGDDAGMNAESDHVTQVRRIAGRQRLPCSVREMLQRTLTRSRGNSGLSSSGVSNTNVVIGVVVEEDHVEESEPREELPRRATVYAQAPSTLSSRITIPGAEKRVSWRSKAGELLRRKARPRRNTLWSITPSQPSMIMVA
jgi:hypothetical protein